MLAGVEDICGGDPSFRVEMRTPMGTSDDESRLILVNVARQAEGAWELKEAKRASRKRKIELKLERDMAKFNKQIALSAPKRVVLLTLMQKMNCGDPDF